MCASDPAPEAGPSLPVEVKYRMAYVGTTAIVDDKGTGLVAHRYGATVEDGPENILERMVQDVCAIRAGRPDLPLVVVQNGAPGLWNRVRETQASSTPSATPRSRTLQELGATDVDPADELPRDADLQLLAAPLEREVNHGSTRTHWSGGSGAGAPGA